MDLKPPQEIIVEGLHNLADHPEDRIGTAAELLASAVGGAGGAAGASAIWSLLPWATTTVPAWLGLSTATVAVAVPALFTCGTAVLAGALVYGLTRVVRSAGGIDAENKKAYEGYKEDLENEKKQTRELLEQYRDDIPNYVSLYEKVINEDTEYNVNYANLRKEIKALAESGGRDYETYKLFMRRLEAAQTLEEIVPRLIKLGQKKAEKLLKEMSKKGLSIDQMKAEIDKLEKPFYKRIFGFGR